jgi:Zn-dependent metalloprotease
MKASKFISMRQVFLNVLIIFVIAATLALGVGSSVAAKGSSQEPKPPDPAEFLADQCLDPHGQVTFQALTGKINFVGTSPNQPIQQPIESLRSATPEEAARGYLSTCGSLFGLSNQADELIVKRQNKVEDGRSVFRFQQTYQGIPVFGGELVVQLNAANDILMVNGGMLPDIKLDTQAGIDAATAQQAALQVVTAQYSMNSEALKVSTPELWIYSPVLFHQDGPTSLVWRMNVTPVDIAPIDELVLVDAQSGAVIWNFNQVDGARNRLTYNLAGSTTSGTLVCDESNPTCSGGDVYAVGAHVYAGDTYDFYNTFHGRDSIDNAGMTILSFVHYSSGYCNAFWDGYEMVYGDGCFLVVDDVVGHEMTHGVTSNESNLVYSYQSGAINESLSDIFGEFIDLWNGKGNDTAPVRWLMGEDTSIGAIRNMKDPTTFSDPDRMGSPFYYTGSSDNGGVHTNSGVGNKAAYLITDGDTFNGYTVTGIGIVKAAKIYYEANTNILTSSSQYADLANALYQGCINLVGTNGIVSANCVEVLKATLATEMITAPPAANNDFGTPEQVSSLPYNKSQSVASATTAGDDPTFPCAGGGQKYETVWYRYAPTFNQTVIINTNGSDYDTVLGVWTGSRGSLVSVGCDDDSGTGTQSQLMLSLTPGVTYYIEAARYGSTPGGNLVLNVGYACTTVGVNVHWSPAGSYCMATGSSTRASYALDNGPVFVNSPSGAPIIASQRVAYNNGTAWTDFSEVMGLPSNQATTGYWFPWYNNIDLNTQIRFANLGATATNIWITIGGVVQPPIPLAAGQSTRVSYPINNGPVKVESSMGNIVASMRVAYNDGTAWTSFSEVLGLPANRATTAYWFPWYNNTTLNTQIRFANIGSTATNIWITIGGVVQAPIPLAAGQSTRVSYPINNGPVKVESSMGNIIASMRVAYNDGTAWTSFSEVLGLPANQATTTYWFPWYNNLTLDTQIRFANLSGSPATVTVTIGGVAQTPIPLAAGQSTRVSYPINSGPVKVQSVGGNIVASMRVAYNDGTAWTSFSEVMGVPANQLTTGYLFPWYNNVGLDTQVRFAVPTP